MDVFPFVVDLTTLTAADGFIIQGDAAFDYAGFSVSSAGDVNCDGFDDMIVGAPFGDNGGGDAGEAYVIFGRAPTSAVTRIGAGGDQTIRGGAFNDTLSGLGGDDTLVGEGGSDSLIGGAGADTMIGGAGNDNYVVDDAGDIVTELAGEGTDKVTTGLAAYTLGANVENLTFTGTINHTGVGNAENNTLVGNAGVDLLFGGSGIDRLYGGTEDDFLIGDAGIDFLYGGTGNDRLYGGTENDVLTAGTGIDRLYGGGGNDRFDFDAIADLSDYILDFQHLIDDVDLATIDANTTAGGNQAFSFIGGAGFSGAAGELRSVAGAGTLNIVQGDINGDSIADFSLRVYSAATLTSGDFLL